MSIATAIQEELQRLDMPQKELARLTKYSRQMVTAWCTGRRKISDEARAEIAQVAPRVSMEICAGCSGNIFIAGWLDGDVDLSIMTGNAKLKEELEELAVALQGLNLVNKVKPEHLSEADREALAAARQEAFDLITNCCMWLVRGAQDYGFDLMAESREHREKLISKRYKKKTA